MRSGATSLQTFQLIYVDDNVNALMFEYIYIYKATRVCVYVCVCVCVSNGNLSPQI